MTSLPSIQKGLIIDTNLLVLYIVGTVNQRRISEFNRTRKYTPSDYELLVRVLGNYQLWFTTPHVLAEVSNLTDMSGRELTLARILLKEMIQSLTEPLVSSAAAAANARYARLGLTDAAIASVAGEQGCAILTDDLDLWLALRTAGMPAINFTHLRELDWA